MENHTFAPATTTFDPAHDPQQQTPSANTNQQRPPRRNYPRNNGANGANANNGPATDEKQEENGKVLKISSTSNSKSVAGALSHMCRQGDSPKMLATGAASVNQAVKALAISRGYLQENKIDLTCYPELRPGKSSGFLFDVVKSKRTTTTDVTVQQLKVSKTSSESALAGAIANKIRDNQRIALVAVGPDSVVHAVKAVSIGRGYLSGDGLDISFRPEFIKVSFEDGSERSALKLTILSQQI